MSSLLPGYEYDIFISYRQNDNQSGWVTEFVKALGEELTATIKNPVSVYFDINPNDGLLETHQIERSLEGKLKCLIFIPIISQTYCDTTSFAWQNEFCAFNKTSKQDALGREIKLSSGNIASRILPIKIHNLDVEDKNLLEGELGGPLRAIEFIYWEAGVNRPLKPEDKKDDNLNKTAYRNQVNKVANAVKEIITSVQHPSQPAREGIGRQPEVISQSGRKRIAWAAAIIILLGLSSFGFIYFGGGANLFFPMPERSIAVLPFVNMSNDPEQEYFSEGMTDEVLNRLFKIGDLKVISRTSSMKFKDAKLTAGEIADQLGVVNILEGSVQKAGNRLKITVQLIDADKDIHLWSETYERELKDVFAIQAEIAQAVARELRAKLSSTVQERLKEIPTQNQIAYEYYLKGRQQYERYFTYGSLESIENAVNLFSMALKEDSLFGGARYLRTNVHLWIYYLNRIEDHVKREEFVAKADKDIEFLKHRLPEATSTKLAVALRLYWVDRKLDEAMKLYLDVLEEDPGNWAANAYVANIQRRQGRWSECIAGMEKSLKADPLNDGPRGQLLFSYFHARQFDKALEICRFGISISPESMPLREFMVYIRVGMGTDLKTAIRESGVSPEAWNRSTGIDLLNLGNLTFLEQRRKDADLVSVSQRSYEPIDLDFSRSYYLKGNRSVAKAYADSAISILSAKLKQMPNDFRIHASLGKSYALAGNESVALQHANEAIKLMPIQLDAFWGTTPELDFAETCIVLGKYDLAMDKIEMLLSIPSEVSVGWLMTHPLYAPLRELPRFKQLMNKYRYQETNVPKPN